MADPTCEERIQSQLEGRLEDFEEIDLRLDRAQRVGNDSKYDAAMDRKYEYPLDIDTKLCVSVLLSTGGPHDEFELIVDPEDGSISTITYIFKDWFDGARKTLSGDEFETAERFLSGYAEIAVEQHRGQVNPF